MTRERLLYLSHDVLLDIADRISIQVDENLDSETLIELILEAMDEDKIEKELSNSLAMRVKEKKYEIIQDEELVCQDVGEYPVPDHYNETSIQVNLKLLL